MGSMKDLLGMLPGVGSKIKDMDVDESQFDRVQAIIFSMTYKERSNPDIINPSRKRRIAAGCGMQVEDVNKLLKQYRDMQKLFNSLIQNPHVVASVKWEISAITECNFC